MEPARWSPDRLLLVLGAQAGLLVGLLGRPLFPSASGFETSFAVVGMAALFTSIVRAPLTGIVLILEMTSSYPLMLPLLAACFTAYALADLLHDRPIDEALLERDLLRGQPPAAEGGRATIVEVLVEEGAPFDGLLVAADLGLPPEGLLITIQREDRDEVPSREHHPARGRPPHRRRGPLGDPRNRGPSERSGLPRSHPGRVGPGSGPLARGPSSAGPERPGSPA